MKKRNVNIRVMQSPKFPLNYAGLQIRRDKFRAAVVGKLSSFGISCRRRRQAFQPWDFVPPPSASFPALGFRAAVVGKLSSFGNSCRRRRQAFQLWDFVPPSSASFPALGIRAAAVGKLSSHQKRNRITSLKFAQMRRARSRNMPAICAYSINLSLGLRRAMIS